MNLLHLSVDSVIFVLWGRNSSDYYAEFIMLMVLNVICVVTVLSVIFDAMAPIFFEISDMDDVCAVCAYFKRPDGCVFYII